MSGTPSSRSPLQVNIESFKDSHDASTFSCGNAYIDRKLRTDVMPMHKLNLTRAFAAVAPGQTEVLGFYSMMPHEILPYSTPKAWEHLISDHSLGAIPAAYITLFATRERCQGRGIGKYMMADALRRIKRTSQEAMGIFAVVLDAADQKAFDFYLKIGFLDMGTERSFRMYYPVSKIP
jgi:ribosomal protein S18 acetylase RimI-like enzyme